MNIGSAVRSQILSAAQALVPKTAPTGAGVASIHRDQPHGDQREADPETQRQAKKQHADKDQRQA